ncbi:MULTISPECIES: CU044_5270 family protein [unclassified Streptomyces]|uniref:CU044_5270 family protein n=1 Tax=unclassified Streptomyces TaxID=2593676 RepID=UPI00165509CD|nr:CU044_5270 family protein [Streptomyces sp. CB02980]MCB8901972.1 CU044_5270 family protein [Streptomyces sp. CB02980]
MNPDPSRNRTANRHETGGLPAIEEHDLPQGRHQFHKERLMSQIHEDRSAAAARTPRNPFLRKAILLPAATALAGALAVGVLVLTPGDAQNPLDRATGPALTTTIGAVDAKGAPRLLDRISLAAAGAEVPNGRAGQYIYIETRSANTHVKTVNGESSLVSDPLHTRQSWRSPDGLKGWLIEPGNTGPEGITLEGRDEKGDVPKPHLGAPSHDYLASLPTDPDALLRKIYEETEGQGSGKDQQAFTTIGDLLVESWPTPKLTAALYRAAAKIPGVVMVDGATDAAGRKGVAVARLDEASGQRTEWIFDSKTFTFLGERTVQVEGDGGEGGLIKPGTVVFTHAIMVRAFVNDIKVVP